MKTVKTRQRVTLALFMAVLLAVGAAVGLSGMRTGVTRAAAAETPSLTLANETVGMSVLRKDANDHAYTYSKAGETTETDATFTGDDTLGYLQVKFNLQGYAATSAYYLRGSGNIRNGFLGTIGIVAKPYNLANQKYEGTAAEVSLDKMIRTTIDGSGTTQGKRDDKRIVTAIGLTSDGYFYLRARQAWLDTVEAITFHPGFTWGTPKAADKNEADSEVGGIKQTAGTMDQDGAPVLQERVTLVKNDKTWSKLTLGADYAAGTVRIDDQDVDAAIKAQFSGYRIMQYDSVNEGSLVENTEKRITVDADNITVAHKALKIGTNEVTVAATQKFTSPSGAQIGVYTGEDGQDAKYDYTFDPEYTQTVEISRSTEYLKSIAVAGVPADGYVVKKYETPSYAGLTVVPTLANEDTNVADKTGEALALTDENVTVSGIDAWSDAQTQTATVTYTYKGITAQTTFAVRIDGIVSSPLAVTAVTDPAGAFFNGDWMQVRFGFGDEAANLKDNYNNINLLNGNHVKDYIEITAGDVTKTYAAWKSEGKSDSVGVFNNKRLVIQGKAADFESITKITFKAGFQWVSTERGDVWGGLSKQNEIDAAYFNDPALVLTQDVSLWLRHSGDQYTAYKWEEYAQSISVVNNGTPQIVIGGVIDKADLTVTAKTASGSTVVPAEHYELEYDASAAGTIDVTVKYQDVQTTFPITVSSQALTGIEITAQPTKTAYKFGELALKPDGLQITAKLHDNSAPVGSQDTTSVLTDAQMKAIEYTGYDPYTLGEQTITAHYGKFTDTFTITMGEYDEAGLTVDWLNGRPYQSAFNSRHIAINVQIPQNLVENTPLKALLYASQPNAAGALLDLVEINGKSLREWWTMKNTPIDWIGFSKDVFVITILPNANRLCYGTSDLLYDETDENCEIVHSVTLKKGFQWYTSSDGQDHWGQSVGVAVPVEYAVLRNDITLINEDDHGSYWARKLKTDVDPDTQEESVAADAYTIVSPATKLEYNQGEALDVSGLVLKVKFFEGDEETVNVAEKNAVKTYVLVSGYNPNKVGKQTISVTYSGATVTYDVEVKGAEQGGDPEKDPDKDKGCGCGGSVAATAAGAGMLLLAAGAVCLLRRKRSHNN